MAEIKASGADIIACGSEILDLYKQYDEQINDLFDSLTKINQGAWSGKSADSFVMKLEVERSIYKNFGDYLRYYGNTVKGTGERIDKMINKWEDRDK